VCGLGRTSRYSRQARAMTAPCTRRPPPPGLLLSLIVSAARTPRAAPSPAGGARVPRLRRAALTAGGTWPDALRSEENRWLSL
jgi:hypothetical protein